MSWPEICLQWSSISKWFGPIKTLSSSTLYCPNFCNEILCSMCVCFANFQLFQIIKLFPGAKLKTRDWSDKSRPILLCHQTCDLNFKYIWRSLHWCLIKKVDFAFVVECTISFFLNFGFSSFPTSKRMYITLLGNKRFTINEMT